MTDRLDEAKRLHSAVAELLAFKKLIVQCTEEPFDIGPCYVSGPIEMAAKHQGKVLAVRTEVMQGVFSQLLRRLEASVDGITDEVSAYIALAEAAEKRVAHSHSNSCSAHLFDDLPCTCGHDALRAAVARVRGQKP